MWWRQTKALVVRLTFLLLARMHARDHFPRLVVSCELSTTIYAFDFLEEGKNTLKCNLEIHAFSYSSYHEFSGHSNIIVDMLLHLSGKPLFEICCFHIGIARKGRGCKGWFSLLFFHIQMGNFLCLGGQDGLCTF